MADLLGAGRVALFSEDRRYRYLLGITWDRALPQLNLNMLNPSTADEQQNDATVARGVERARRMGFGGLLVTNAYAYKATMPAEMKRAAKAGVDIIGPENDRHIVEAARRAKMVICAWGPTCGKRRQNDVLRLIRTLAHRKPYALQFTRGGYPSHPLYLSYDGELIEILYPNFCMGCGFEIAPDGGEFCGECACEDDCAP